MNTPSIWKYVHKGLVAILSLIVVATIILIVFLGFTLQRLDALITTSGYSVRSALVLQNLMIDLSNAAHSARDYVLTGNKASDAAYELSVAQANKQLAVIQGDANYHLSLSEISNLKSLSDQRVALLKQETNAYTAGDLTAANAILDGNQGNRVMSQIRDQLSMISAHNQSAIWPRQQKSHAYLHRALYVAVAVSIFVIGICFTIVWYFQHTILRERALENSKSEFLSLASHQLRTPATNVKQYVGLLLDGYLGDLSEKQLNALKIAYKNNESEIRIMNDLLDVAKLDLQRIHLHKQPTNVVAAVKQVIKQYQVYATGRGQSLALTAPDQLSALVDQTYFKGVIEKLVDNAVKYSHDKTRVTVIINL